MLTPNNRQLLRQLINSSYDKATLERGQELYRNDHVDDVQCMDQTDDFMDLYAQVIGSQGDVYELSITADDEMIESYCSCYVGYNCKHGAAVIYDLLSETSPATHSPQPENTLELWLDKLRSTRNTTTESKPLGTKQWHLFFVLHLRNEGPSIEMRERYLKVDGNWGKNDRSVSPYYLLRDRYAESAHQQIAKLFISDQAQIHVDNNIHYTLEGASGRKALRLAASCQRLLDAKTLQSITEDLTRQLEFSWHESNGTHQLQATLINNQNAAETQAWQLLQVEPPMYLVGNSLGAIDTSLSAAQIDLLMNMPPIPKVRLAEVCANFQHLVDTHNLPAPDIQITLTHYNQPIAKAKLCCFRHRTQGVLPALKLTMVYGPIEIPIEFDEATKTQYATDKGEYFELDNESLLIERDYKKEYEHCKQLREQGLEPCHYGDEYGELWTPMTFNAPDHLRRWHALQPKLEEFFSTHNWLVEIEGNYSNTQVQAQFSGSANNYLAGWFDLELKVDIPDVSISTSDLIAQWLHQNCPTTMAIQGDQQQWVLADMSAAKPIAQFLAELNQKKSENGIFRIPHFKAGELDAIEHISYKQAPDLKKLQQKLRSFKGLSDAKPSKFLRAELRDYQQQGLNWLNFLHQYQFGGILADDMGLGKTLQTLAFIQKLKNGRKLKNGALIIAPTSLLWNWQTEAEKFTPNLRCAILHGNDRISQFNSMGEYDLIVTTYGLILRDLEHHKQSFYDLVVLDEAQKIKNKNAKITHAVHQLPCDMRLCLTGTPLENHLGELWSLMNFAQPELLGNSEHFQTFYRKEIENEKNIERNKSLSTKIAPFLLRRTKSEVVKELPKKSEIIQTVHLEKDQKKLYESIRISMEKRIRDLIKQKGIARTHIEFLDALLKLRQACIDPRLVSLDQAKQIKQSAKMEWLRENVPELVEEGRSILIFSQFTKMLDLIEQELTAANIATVKLTGRTRNRKATIDAFQQGEVPVFLISLKAGGAGLNLTTADSVIHVDPWWNPAVENQATDRAYRIGQEKPVFVYKLVAANTVEEKIQAMQQHKQALADSLFDATNKAKLPLSGDELLHLFEK